MNNLNHELVLITHLTANPTNKEGFDIDKKYVSINGKFRNYIV